MLQLHSIFRDLRRERPKAELHLGLGVLGGGDGAGSLHGSVDMTPAPICTAVCSPGSRPLVPLRPGQRPPQRRLHLRPPLPARESALAHCREEIRRGGRAHQPHEAAGQLRQLQIYNIYFRKTFFA